MRIGGRNAIVCGRLSRLYLPGSILQLAQSIFIRDRLSVCKELRAFSVKGAYDEALY